MKKISLSLSFLFLFLFSFSQTQDFSKGSKKVAKNAAKKLRKRAVEGESMKKLAVLYSEDPGSASRGGLYENIAKGVMDTKFEKVAFSLKKGQISKVFETEYGYHFIQIVKHHDRLIDLRHILIVPKENKISN